MRRSLLSFSILLPALLAASAAADERFPYSAFVTADGAAVRSGPAETFYPVLELRRGDAVEVWRHDPGGWCAVRPPEGSFSWISGDFVESADGRTGTIVGNQVNVRIGTRFSDARDVVQLQLNDDEQVDLLDARLLTTGERLATWYKIAPPAGEFRWVHERDLTRDVRPTAPEVATTNVAPSTAPRDVQAAGFADDGEGQPPHPRPLSHEARGETEALLARVNALPSDATTQEVLNELEIVLSTMVAAEPTAWHFTELKQHGEGLVERAETAVERSRVRQFLGKLARLEDIAKRYAAVADVRAQTTQVDQALQATAAVETDSPRVSSNASPLTPGPSPARGEVINGSSTVDTSRYDGVGRLTQIVLREDGATNFALTNERGEVTAYLTAAPGVNLRQYAGLDVGVNGIRGFIREQGMPQIAVKRVDTLGVRR